MSVTSRLCDKITAIEANDIGADAIARARQLVLDGIAVAVAGARIETAPRILADYLRAQASKPESSPLGFGFRLAPLPAPLLKPASTHALDFEPVRRPATRA